MPDDHQAGDLTPGARLARGTAGPPTTLGRLAEVAGRDQGVSVIGDSDTVITDLHHDSRHVGRGSAFIAVPGATTDGHDFVASAVRRGAAALIVEYPIALDVPQLVVEAVRPLMGALAAEVHGHPASAMTVIGVTGTNGKTTVTHMIESIAAAAGRRCAVLGTLGARIDGEVHPVGHTTPEATDLQRWLGTMRTSGIEVVAMEVSSHALSYGRVEGVRFAVAAFTNLSQDHLDFHGDMEGYMDAKRLLFDRDRSARAVVFVGDRRGAELAASVDIPVTSVAIEGGATGGAAGGVGTIDVEAVDLDVGATTLNFKVKSRLPGVSGTFPVTVPLGAWFNAANALVAWACAATIGIDPTAIATGLAVMPTVPGRFETIDEGQPFTVIVDYAHTPEAMERVIEAVRPEPPGRLIALGGAGGDRDRSKRPLMGAALARADLAVLTSDNPRSEDPMEILAAVESGARHPAADGTGGGSPEAELVVEPDRRVAIRTAVQAARPGDVVILLGKGHETGQDVSGTVHPFDDRTVAVEELRRMAGGMTP